MKNFVKYFLIGIVGFSLIILFLGIMWHHIAFKYIFQFFTSFALLMAGIFFLFKGNLSYSLTSFLMSIIFFFISNILFFNVLKYNNLSTGSGFYNIWHNFLNRTLFIASVKLKTWHVLLISGLFANGMVVSKSNNNLARKLLGANLIAIMFTIIIFF